VRALLSVADRDGIIELGRELAALGVDLIATEGTRDHLRAHGIEAAALSDLTGTPALAGGLVRTLHPAIHAGILARRDRPEELAELEEAGIGLIDLVVVNLRPFAPQVGVRVVPMEEAVGMMDTAGPALLAAAARSHYAVAAVPHPRHYPTIVAEIRERGVVSAETRRSLAAESFAVVAAYHAEIAAYLNRVSGETFPAHMAIILEKVGDLPYGENPHQTGAAYRETTHRNGTVADARRLGGRRPSFNDMLDLDAAYRIATDFAAPTAVIVRHTDPVGIASADDLVEAYRAALQVDPVSSFGSVVGLNGEVDGPTAREIVLNHFEAVVAPGYTDAALAILSRSPELEILAVPPNPVDGPLDYGIAALDFKRISGGALLETRDDDSGLDRSQLRVVTRRRPTLEELTDLLFAWRAVRNVRSNAIVIARNLVTVGIGAAQVSRLAAVEIAVHRAGDRARSAVLASDAYFPFPDAIALAAQAGVSAVIQPGGSIRDETAIEVADRNHLAMVFTGRRHFRH
jgi:phosphoribosylaminoimidazolecarboxamide formyltransferase/IMP cyclohydrolase